MRHIRDGTFPLSFLSAALVKAAMSSLKSRSIPKLTAAIVCIVRWEWKVGQHQQVLEYLCVFFTLCQRGTKCLSATKCSFGGYSYEKANSVM